MSELKVNKVSPSSGTGVQLGDSGDTITIPSGATITNSGTATNFGDSFGLSNNSIALKDAGGNLGGLSIGTAGQVLTVNSGATGFEFATPASGGGSDIEEIGSATVTNQSSGAVTDIDITPTYNASTYYLYKVVGWIDTHAGDGLRCRLLDTSGNAVTTSSYKAIRHYGKQTAVSGGVATGGSAAGSGGDSKWDLTTFGQSINQGYGLASFVYYHTPQGWGSGWSNNGYKNIWGWHQIQKSGNDLPSPQTSNLFFDGSAAQHNGLRFSFLFNGSVKDAVIKYYGFKK